MGQTVTNVNAGYHRAGVNGSNPYALHVHRGDIALDVDLGTCTQAAWRAVRGAVQGADRGAYELAAEAAWPGFAALPQETRDAVWAGHRDELVL